MSRPAPSSAALPIAYVVLRVLIVVNWLTGAAILALLVVMPNEQWIISAFRLSPSRKARSCAKTSKGQSDMAIAVKLDDLLHDRRMTLTELADRIGMTLANLSILKTGKARAIRFSTLDAICEALSCQPGDLLRFEPKPATASKRSASR